MTDGIRVSSIPVISGAYPYQGSALPLSYGSDVAAYAHEIPANQAFRGNGADRLTCYILALGSGTLHEPALKSGKNPGSPVPVMYEGE